MSIETVECDQGCGAHLFKFADVTRCNECTVRLDRAAMPDAEKAAQWDEAMTWLDRRPLPYPLNAHDSIDRRLDDLWRQVWD